MQAALLPKAVKPHIFYRLALIGLLLAAIGSVVRGGADTVHRSQDFQWSGTTLLLHHFDPWAEYLRGDPDHRIFMQQVPNYLPILYLIMSPLGFMREVTASVVWFFLNVAFAVTSTILTARFYGLGRMGVMAVIGLLLCATPTRNTLGNGQQGLLVLLLWSLSLFPYRITDGRAAIAGVSYYKFSFAPPIFLYLLLRRGLRAVLVSIVPCAIATFIAWFWIGQGSHPSTLLRLVTEPLEVARTGYFPSGGDSNLMDVLQYLLEKLHVPAVFIDPFVVAAASLLCFIVLFAAIRLRPSSSIQWQLALMAIMSFGFFRHHTYDSVVLLLPFCYAIRFARHRGAPVVIAIIGYLWYFQRVIDFFWGDLPFTFLIHFAMLMLMLYIVWTMQTAEPAQQPSNTERDAAQIPVTA